MIKDWLNNSKLHQWQLDHIFKKMDELTLIEPVPVFAVDGDIVAYRTAAVCEEEFEGSCNAIIDATLRDIATETGIEYMRIYISGDNNFRYDVAKTLPYKGNRDGFVRPRFLQHCKNYLVSKYNAIVVDGFEADDAICTDMTVYGAIHCGIDKDMLQIAGKHYDYVNKIWRHVTPEEATITLYRQILTGDKSDNVPGLPKVGPKTAEKHIQNHETAAEDALEVYKQVCADKLPDVNPIEYMAEQMKLIKMVTNVNFDMSRTVRIELNTDGFEGQEGDFDGVEEDTTKRPVRSIALL